MAKASPGVLKLPGRFQFLGIPPKGEQAFKFSLVNEKAEFPISRDPPEGGTSCTANLQRREVYSLVSNF